MQGRWRRPRRAGRGAKGSGIEGSARGSFLREVMTRHVPGVPRALGAASEPAPNGGAGHSDGKRVGRLRSSHTAVDPSAKCTPFVRRRKREVDERASQRGD